MKQNILVTGGTGYIGSHTVVELLNKDYNVTIMDNLCNSDISVLSAIEKITGKKPKFIKCDLLDAQGVDKIFADKFDAVIHFAGLKAVGESVEKPIEYYENNVTGTINLLKSMQKHGVKKIVFSSSATVYGDAKTVPITEDTPLSTTNPYGTTKLVIEGILRDLCHADPKFCAVILRYFNPIGANESGLIGENPRGIPNNLAPYIAQVISGIRPHLNIFGNDYDTPDGTGVRDYIHVVDLALGHIASIEKIKSAGAYEINLGTGRGTSVLELLHAFERASNKTIPYKICPRRAGDVATSYADPSKAHKILGWSAKRNTDNMCSTMLRYYAK